MVDEWNKLDRNRERRERDHENLRGDVPLEFQAVPDPKIAPLDESAEVPSALSGNFLDIIFSCPYELHELTANRFLSKLFSPSVMNRKKCCITCSSSNTAPQGLPPSEGSPTGTSESAPDHSEKAAKADV